MVYYGTLAKAEKEVTRLDSSMIKQGKAHRFIALTTSCLYGVARIGSKDHKRAMGEA